MTGAEEVALDNFREITKHYHMYSFMVYFAMPDETFMWKKFVRDLKRGHIKITPEFMRSIESPELKQKVIEAICLAKV